MGLESNLRLLSIQVSAAAAAATCSCCCCASGRPDPNSNHRCLPLCRLWVDANTFLRSVPSQSPTLAAEGVWAHATPVPEPGGLLLATRLTPSALGSMEYWQASSGLHCSLPPPLPPPGSPSLLLASSWPACAADMSMDQHPKARWSQPASQPASRLKRAFRALPPARWWCCCCSTPCTAAWAWC